MSIPRPLTKPALKKLYLKTLYEILHGSLKGGIGWSISSIVTQMPRVCSIDPLDDDERLIAHRAAYELERDGFIQSDITQSSEFKIFMPRGIHAVESANSDVELGWIDIDELLSRDDLKSKVRDDYVEGDYESCVFKAFRMLEECVRSKSQLDAEKLGTTLMSDAFKPSGGLLRHPSAVTDGEQEGLHALMRGAIGWFKNPSSHRTVSHDDPQTTAMILSLANYLLDKVDESVLAS